MQQQHRRALPGHGTVDGHAVDLKAERFETREKLQRRARAGLRLRFGARGRRERCGSDDRADLAENFPAANAVVAHFLGTSFSSSPLVASVRR